MTGKARGGSVNFSEPEAGPGSSSTSSSGQPGPRTVLLVEDDEAHADIVEEAAQRHVKSDTGNLHAMDPIREMLICWGSSRFSSREKISLLLVMRAKAFSYLSFPAYTQFCG